MKKIALFIVLLVSILNAGEDSKKVVFNLTTGDMKVFETKILSGIANFKAHYQTTLEDLDVAVVIHGEAYKFFIENLSSSPYKDNIELKKNHDALSKRLLSMSELYNVEFLICQRGMKKLKIKDETLYSFVKIVPNSTIGLIDKQNDGYAYIPVAK
jgi:uncharacterized protein